MKIALTGATGFVGSALVTHLSQAGHSLKLLVRRPEKARSLFPHCQIVPYQATLAGDWFQAIADCEAVINLAGEPISERWTPEYKEAILQSRQVGTRKIVEAIAQAPQRPKVLINASAIGYYGISETACFDETASAGQDFLAQVCQAWEEEARAVTNYGVRLAILRSGIVLGAGGGALAKMLPPFQLFAGGPIGSGKQWFSWIDLVDLLRLVEFVLMREDLQGVFNATAPTPVRMAEFCQTLGQVLNRPSWLPVPDLALELLLGEAAQLVLEGQKVIPQAAIAAGFEFQYPQLLGSLENILLSSGKN
jgi:hypothetical protein